MAELTNEELLANEAAASQAAIPAVIATDQEAVAAGQPTELNVDAVPAAAAPVAAAKPATEKPKAPAKLTPARELYERIKAEKIPDLAQLITGWKFPKFEKLLTTNKDFQKDFYADLMARGSKITPDEFYGYYSGAWSKEKVSVHSIPPAAKLPEASGPPKESPGFIVSNLNKLVDLAKDQWKGINRAMSQGKAIQTTDVASLSVGDVNRMDFVAMANAIKEVDSYTPANYEIDFQNHEGVWDTTSDWAKMIMPTIVESMVTLGRSGYDNAIAGAGAGATWGLIGGPAAPVTSAAGALSGAGYGMATAGYHMELFATIVDELKASGINVTDPKELKAAFEDKALITPILKKANIRAGVIAAVDLVGAGALGNIGSKFTRLLTKVATKAPGPLKSHAAKVLSSIGKAKGFIENSKVQQIATKIAQSKTGKVVSKIDEKINLGDAGTAVGGELAAQKLSGQKVDVEAGLLEGVGEFKYIGTLRYLFKKSRQAAAGGTAPAATPSGAAPAPGAPPAPAAPAVPPAASPASPDYEQSVSQDELDAYETKGEMHPDRKRAIDADVEIAMKDPKHMETLAEDPGYFKIAEMELKKRLHEEEKANLLETAIADVAEKNNIDPDDLKNMIDPDHPNFDKEKATAVENVFTHLADMFQKHTLEEETVNPVEGATATAPAEGTDAVAPAEGGVTTTAPVEGAAATGDAPTQTQVDELFQEADALLAEANGHIAALQSGKQTMPLQEIQAMVVQAKELRDKGAELQTQVQNDSQNVTGVSSQVGSGQESQQAQPVEGGSTQETGGSGILQTPGAEEQVTAAPVVNDAMRAIAKVELTAKALVKNGQLVYKNKKPVYNGKQFKNTRELENYLQTDEGIAEAVQFNQNIAAAANQETATIAPSIQPVETATEQPAGGVEAPAPVIEMAPISVQTTGTQAQETAPATTTPEGEVAQKPVSEAEPAVMPAHIEKAYARRAILKAMANDLQKQMAGKESSPKIQKELDEVLGIIKSIDFVIDKYNKEQKAKEETAQKPEEKPSEQKPVEETKPEAPVVEQEEVYQPITVKDLSHSKFSKNEADSYETDQREVASGMSEYISEMRNEVTENENGDSVGTLIRLTDEDGTHTWQAEDVNGDELSEDGFDDKPSAMQALADAWNKQQKKEFNKEKKAEATQKRKAEEKQATEKRKADEKQAAETAKMEKVPSMFQAVDAIIDTQSSSKVKGNEARTAFTEEFGKKPLEDMMKITVNFDKIINALVDKGLCTKKCP